MIAAKSLQLCLTLCDPIDSSPLGSFVPGILQARIPEWAAISFSNAWKWKVKVKSLSCARLFATPRTAAYQAPLSMGFCRQEYWSGVPLPSPTGHAKFLQMLRVRERGRDLNIWLLLLILGNESTVDFWSPVTSWQIEGEKWNQWHILFSWTPKSLWMVTAAMKLKDTCSLKGKLW